MSQSNAPASFLEALQLAVQSCHTYYARNLNGLPIQSFVAAAAAFRRAETCLEKLYALHETKDPSIHPDTIVLPAKKLALSIADATRAFESNPPELDKIPTLIDGALNDVKAILGGRIDRVAATRKVAQSLLPASSGLAAAEILPDFDEAELKETEHQQKLNQVQREMRLAAQGLKFLSLLRKQVRILQIALRQTSADLKRTSRTDPVHWVKRLAVEHITTLENDEKLRAELEIVRVKSAYPFSFDDAIKRKPELEAQLAKLEPEVKAATDALNERSTHMKAAKQSARDALKPLVRSLPSRITQLPQWPSNFTEQSPEEMLIKLDEIEAILKVGVLNCTTQLASLQSAASQQEIQKLGSKLKERLGRVHTDLLSSADEAERARAVLSTLQTTIDTKLAEARTSHTALEQARDEAKAETSRIDELQRQERLAQLAEPQAYGGHASAYGGHYGGGYSSSGPGPAFPSHQPQTSAADLLEFTFKSLAI